MSIISKIKDTLLKKSTKEPNTFTSTLTLDRNNLWKNFNGYINDFNKINLSLTDAPFRSFNSYIENSENKERTAIQYALQQLAFKDSVNIKDIILDIYNEDGSINYLNFMTNNEIESLAKLSITKTNTNSLMTYNTLTAGLDEDKAKAFVDVAKFDMNNAFSFIGQSTDENKATTLAEKAQEDFIKTLTSKQFTNARIANTITELLPYALAGLSNKLIDIEIFGNLISTLSECAKKSGHMTLIKKEKELQERLTLLNKKKANPEDTSLYFSKAILTTPALFIWPFKEKSENEILAVSKVCDGIESLNEIAKEYNENLTSLFELANEYVTLSEDENRIKLANQGKLKKNDANIDEIITYYKKLNRPISKNSFDLYDQTFRKTTSSWAGIGKINSYLSNETFNKYNKAFIQSQNFINNIILNACGENAVIKPSLLTENAIETSLNVTADGNYKIKTVNNLRRFSDVKIHSPLTIMKTLMESSNGQLSYFENNDKNNIKIEEDEITKINNNEIDAFNKIYDLFEHNGILISQNQIEIIEEIVEQIRNNPTAGISKGDSLYEIKKYLTEKVGTKKFEFKDAPHSIKLALYTFTENKLASNDYAKVSTKQKEKYVQFFTDAYTIRKAISLGTEIGGYINSKHIDNTVEIIEEVKKSNEEALAQINTLKTDNQEKQEITRNVINEEVEEFNNVKASTKESIQNIAVEKDRNNITTKLENFNLTNVDEELFEKVSTNQNLDLVKIEKIINEKTSSQISQSFMTEINLQVDERKKIIDKFSDYAKLSSTENVHLDKKMPEFMIDLADKMELDLTNELNVSMWLATIIEEAVNTKNDDNQSE